MNHVLIKNVRLVHASHTDKKFSDVYVVDDKIAGVGQQPEGFVAQTVIDGAGACISFGLADLATRFSAKGGHRYNVMADVLNGAVAGGVTHVAVLPDASPILDEASLVTLLTSRSDALGLSHVYPIGALTQGLEGELLAPMASLAQHGCVAFSQADVTIQNTQVLQRALQYAASFNLPVWLRAQDYYLGQGEDAYAASGAYASRLGLSGVAVAAETVALYTLFELLRGMGNAAPRVHVCRISSARAVDLIRTAKAEGLNVSCDVNVHHLHLVDTDMGYFDSQFVFNPPLRTSSDRAALRAAVLDGTIDVVVSDHTAVDADAKDLPVGLAQAGALGVQWLISLLVKVAREERVDLAVALSSAVSRAYRVLGLPEPLWQVGAHADLVVFDEAADWMLTSDVIRGGHSNTPFLAYELPASVTATLVSGRVVYAVV